MACHCIVSRFLCSSYELVLNQGGFYNCNKKLQDILQLLQLLGDEEEVCRTDEILKMYLLLVQLDELILLETVKQMTV